MDMPIRIKLLYNNFEPTAESRLSGTPSYSTMECDSETCLFNPKGICLAPLFTEKPPTITEDEGCLDYMVKDE